MFPYSDPGKTLKPAKALANYRMLLHIQYRQSAKLAQSAFTLLEAFQEVAPEKQETAPVEWVAFPEKCAGHQNAQIDADRFLQRPTPVEALRQTVSAYLGRVRGQLADAAQRQAEITRLYQVMLDRRRATFAHTPALVESPQLFPTGQAP
jgi:hypothetical protein